MVNSAATRLRALASVAIILATGPAAATKPAPMLLAQAGAPTIPVVAPKVQAVAETLEITGNAAAVAEVKLVARVPGYLEQLHFEDGGRVHKGDLLAVVQQDQYKAQLQQADAQVQAQLAALLYAKTEVGRYRALLKRDAATQVEVDHWVFQQASAEANLIGAKAQQAIAQLNLSYTEIRAPFDGLMSRHLIDVGNMVGESASNATLATIQQTDPIYVVANISSQSAGQIRANLNQRRLTLAEIHQVKIDVALSDSAPFSYHGRLEYVAPDIDQTTGTLLVRGLVDNPDRALVPGMFVRIRLPMGKVLSSALLVPDASLQEDQGGRYLLVVGPDNVVQQRYVKLGEVVGALHVITSGITADDRIVTGEVWRAAPGTKIVPQLTELPQ